MPQAAIFSIAVESLKEISLTPHASSELKFLDYGAITVEFVNCLPTKFNGDIHLSFLLFIICWDILDNCKVWIEGMMVMLGVSCRLVTSIILLDWASK